ncbi:mannitol dehydrogenase family protein [Neotamlana laminarinivorans]|uniref:Mannitol dehydrogenase family protein n=1 Tax=Neotamlana laminarinivorans TaxID=2883124 RepID=A0A9X1I084_9FLAO|nr:mannitol dehydrogenase family protein [Tamlana laminarinivorans]MCB4799045.1 mannitol dehydrogenase family protein [Tamlana laminarinivorans]
MAKTYQLNMENLKLLPESVLKPTYNRDLIKTSILHIGVSSFHRSHQAYYINELIEKYNVLNYGICGVDLLESDRKIYNILKDQDGLYTLYTKAPSGHHKAKVIGAIVEYFFGPENPLAVIEKIANPDIKIITLTIAEDGYQLNQVTGAFDINQPLINNEIKNQFSPKTVFGYLAQGLKLRKLRNLPGCTILSCDNIKANGDTIKEAFFNYIKQTEPELLDWVKKNTTFPNSMVDRITTVTSTDDINELKDIYALDDQWPVISESFNQWIIEDNFLEKRPDWEKVGVVFTKKITPFEKMKLRVLNAGHTILGVLGTMCGYKTVFEAATDSDIMQFFKQFVENEITKSLNDFTADEIEDYKHLLITRFQNPYINDRLSRICSESSAKIPLFVLPTINDLLNSNNSLTKSAFIIAAWCKYNDGVDDNKVPYKITDNISGTLIRNAALSLHNPKKFLEIESVFGNLSYNETFTKSYEASLKLLRTHSTKAAIQIINTK